MWPVFINKTGRLTFVHIKLSVGENVLEDGTHLVGEIDEQRGVEIEKELLPVAVAIVAFFCRNII